MKCLLLPFNGVLKTFSSPHYAIPFVLVQLKDSGVKSADTITARHITNGARQLNVKCCGRRFAESSNSTAATLSPLEFLLHERHGRRPPTELARPRQTGETSPPPPPPPPLPPPPPSPSPRRTRTPLPSIIVRVIHKLPIFSR